MMTYRVNIHHPREKTEESFQSQCKVYIQKKTEHYKDEIEYGDIFFIYETARPERVIIAQDAGGKREVHLRQGAKGIIAMVKINSDFHDGDWLWDNDKYIGYFETEIIEAKIVTLDTINIALKDSGVQSPFVPLVYGGIKPLDYKKAKVLKRLMQQGG